MAASNSASSASYARRLLTARTRLLVSHGFYGLLLMAMRFALDEGCETAATDGRTIFFAPSFLDGLSDEELDFVLMHEVTHAALRHCARRGGRDAERYNVACDIVVNSNILKAKGGREEAIAVGGVVSMHRTPGGEEGWRYTAEEVYALLGGDAMRVRPGKWGQGAGSRRPGGDGPAGRALLAKEAAAVGATLAHPGFRDDHERWESASGSSGTEADEGTAAWEDAQWEQRIAAAAQAASRRRGSSEHGSVPAFAERMLRERRSPQVDWRQVLADFVSQEVVDYTLLPPDRRFVDGDFLLPSFSEKDEWARDVLFMVDTSASVSDALLAQAFGEVVGALESFEGRLEGWLGFFDVHVKSIEPIAAVSDVLAARPRGGGGTSFTAMLADVFARFEGRLPACIVIISDGFAPWPPAEAAHDVPVLWLLCGTQKEPPWGRVVRLPREL